MRDEDLQTRWRLRNVARSEALGVADMRVGARVEEFLASTDMGATEMDELTSRQASQPKKQQTWTGVSS